MVKRLLAGLLLVMAMGIGSLLVGGVAHADTTCGTFECGPIAPTGTPSVTPADTPAPTPPAANTQAATSSTPFTSSSSLAFTGADIAGTVVLGGVLIGGGLVFVRVSRRRRVHT